MSLLKFWIQVSYECIENPNDYRIELLIKGKGKEFGCEVEVKLGWNGPTFTFPTLNSPTMFIVMNKRFTHGAVVSRKLILGSHTRCLRLLMRLYRSENASMMLLSMALTS